MGKSFFVIKLKRKVFLDKYETNFIWFRTVEGPSSLENIAKALRNWTQFGSNSHDKYSIVFWEKCLVTIFEAWTSRK